MGEAFECNLKFFGLGYVLKTDDKEILLAFEAFDEEEASDLAILYVKILYPIDHLQ